MQRYDRQTEDQERGLPKAYDISIAKNKIRIFRIDASKSCLIRTSADFLVELLDIIKIKPVHYRINNYEQEHCPICIHRFFAEKEPFG